MPSPSNPLKNSGGTESFLQSKSSLNPISDIAVVICTPWASVLESIIVIIWSPGVTILPDVIPPGIPVSENRVDGDGIPDECYKTLDDDGDLQFDEDRDGDFNSDGFDNDDFDCIDGNGGIFFGDPTDSVADDCWDENNLLISGFTEQIDEDNTNGPNDGITILVDEDQLDGIDNDGDGAIDEDTGFDVGANTPAQIKACNDTLTINLNAGESVDILCTSASANVIYGEVDVIFSGNGFDITTTLGAQQKLKFDPDTNSVTAGDDTDVDLIIGAITIPVSSGQRIQNILGGDIIPPAVQIDSVKDADGNLVQNEGGVMTDSVTAEFSSADTDTDEDSFECKIDEGTFENCTSPKTFGGLDMDIHTISVRATDFTGNIGEPESFSFFVIIEPSVVQDDVDPVFNNIADITVSATNPNGALVNYATPIATDNVDPAPVVVCAPPSGSTFPIGDTLVTCTATDNSGNSAQTTFTITVEDTTSSTITPAEAISLLIDDMGESGLDERTIRSLQWLLNAALDLEEDENHDNAISKLLQFQSRLNMFIGRGFVTSEIGQPFLDSAQVIIESDPGVGIIVSG